MTGPEIHEELATRQVDYAQHLLAQFGPDALETDWEFDPYEEAGDYAYGHRRYELED
jgi:hypothetical protein